MSTDALDNVQEIASRLNKVLLEIGQNQTELANSLGLSRTYVSELVRGARAPGSKVLKALTDHFGVSASWLLCGAGPMFLHQAAEAVKPSRPALGGREGWEIWLQQMRRLLDQAPASPQTHPEIYARVDKLLALGGDTAHARIVGYLDGLEANMATLAHTA